MKLDIMYLYFNAPEEWHVTMPNHLGAYSLAVNFYDWTIHCYI